MVPGHTEYRYLIRKGPGAIDDLDHVNTAIYLTWGKEAIAAYLRCVPPPAERLFVDLAAARHEIVFYRPAVLHDMLVAIVQVTNRYGCRMSLETRFESAAMSVALMRSTVMCVDQTMRQFVPSHDHPLRHTHPSSASAAFVSTGAIE